MTETTNKNNTKYVDLLDEDKPLAGQKFVCVSFISPDNIIKKKEHYFFERFLKHYDFNKSMLKFQEFLNFVSFKHELNFDKLMEDYTEFIETEKENLRNNNITEEYKTFLDHKEEDLEKEFNEVVDFKTNVRGLKVRGVFETQKEAELRCKMLREVDPNHDIFVGPVGMWMPWEPDAYKTGRVEYLEKELNELMNNKSKNEMEAKNEFEQRVKETKKNAIEENISKAKESGNKLTQNVDEEGNLVGVDGGSTLEKTIKQSSSADIKKELFEGDNIILKKDKEE